MKKSIVFLITLLIIISSCKKNSFDLPRDNNYALKSFNWEYDEVELYYPGDTVYIAETFVEFNDDMEEYRKDPEHQIDDHHIFDAFWLLFSNLNFEYGNLMDSVCPDTTATFTIIVDIIGVENDTPIVNGQSIADEVIDASEDISELVPDGSVLYFIDLSIKDITEDEMEIEATIHFTSPSGNCAWHGNPTSSPKQFVSGDHRRAVTSSACGGDNSPDPAWWAFQLRLNPDIYWSNATMRNVGSSTGLYIFIGSNRYYYGWLYHPNSFWHGVYPTECMGYVLLNYYMNAAAYIYANLTFPNSPNKHVYLIDYNPAQQEFNPHYYYHWSWFWSGYFIEYPDED